MPEGSVILHDRRYCYIKQDGYRRENLFCYEMETKGCRKLRLGSRVVFDTVPNDRRSGEKIATNVKRSKKNGRSHCMKSSAIYLTSSSRSNAPQ